MDIEILGFFKSPQSIKNFTFSGTLVCRVKHADPAFDYLIRGIFVGKSRKNQKWIVSLPGRLTIHSISGMECRYPIFTLVDKEAQDKLEETIHQKSVAFAKDWREKNEPKPIEGNVSVRKARTFSIAKNFVEPPKNAFKRKSQKVVR
jgi:hypothetical protein